MLENAPVTVWIVAASAIGRAGLTALVEADEELQAAGAGAGFAALPAGSDDFRFQIVLVHLENQIQIDSFKQFLAAGAEDESSIATVALFAPDLHGEQLAAQLLQAGANGVLPDEATEHQISAAIKAAAAGLTVVDRNLLQISRSVAAANNFAKFGDSTNADVAESLTPRESEVLELLAEGASNKIIARRLAISEHTVKFHVSSVFGKLGAATRTEAVTEGLRRGLILL